MALVLAMVHFLPATERSISVFLNFPVCYRGACYAILLFSAYRKTVGEPINVNFMLHLDEVRRGQVAALNRRVWVETYTPNVYTVASSIDTGKANALTLIA